MCVSVSVCETVGTFRLKLTLYLDVQSLLDSCLTKAARIKPVERDKGINEKCREKVSIILPNRRDRRQNKVMVTVI